MQPPLSDDDLRRQDWRSLRWWLKETQRVLSPSKSSRQCMFPVASFVAVTIGRLVTAHVAGVARCASSWSCVTCAPMIRSLRAQEIDEAAARHLAAGGGIELVTFTTRHRRYDDLAPRLKLLAGCLDKVLKGSAWERRKDRLGFVGTIKALETTYGWDNGWHPHAHVLFFFARPLTDDERQDLEEWLFGRWSASVTGAGFGAVTPEHGLDVRPVRTTEELGGYLTKVEGKGRTWSAGAEMARGDLKSGGEHLVPFEILAGFAESGEGRLAALWIEYEEATFGIHSLRWSPGLKSRLDVEEVTDEEAAASEGIDPAPYFRWLVAATIWRRMMRQCEAADFLSECERQAARRLAIADLLGEELVPLEDHEHTDIMQEE